MWTVKMEVHEIGFAQSITWWVVHDIEVPDQPFFQTKNRNAAIRLAKLLEVEAVGFGQEVPMVALDKEQHPNRPCGKTDCWCYTTPLTLRRYTDEEILAQNSQREQP